MKLKDKVAFITGFGSGLGQAIAVMFAREGAAVAGTSPTGSKGRETVALVEKLGRPVSIVEGSARNIKITTVEDLAIAEAILAAD